MEVDAKIKKQKKIYCNVCGSEKRNKTKRLNKNERNFIFYTKKIKISLLA